MQCDACHRALMGPAANMQLVMGEVVTVSGSGPRLRPTGGTSEWLLCGTCAAYVEAGIRHLIASGGADATTPAGGGR